MKLALHCTNKKTSDLHDHEESQKNVGLQSCDPKKPGLQNVPDTTLDTLEVTTLNDCDDVVTKTFNLLDDLVINNLQHPDNIPDLAWHHLCHHDGGDEGDVGHSVPHHPAALEHLLRQLDYVLDTAEGQVCGQLGGLEAGVQGGEGRKAGSLGEDGSNGEAAASSGGQF